jgi:hypothetical protein
MVVEDGWLRKRVIMERIANDTSLRLNQSRLQKKKRMEDLRTVADWLGIGTVL